MVQKANPSGAWRDAVAVQESPLTQHEIELEKLALLRRIAARLDTLPSELAAAVRAPTAPIKPLRPADFDRLSRLLPLALGEIGQRPRVALASDLLEQLRLQGPDTDAAAVLDEFKVAKHPAMKLSHLLRRAIGHQVSGIAIARHDELRGVTVFRFSRV